MDNVWLLIFCAGILLAKHPANAMNPNDNCKKANAMKPNDNCKKAPSFERAKSYQPFKDSPLHLRKGGRLFSESASEIVNGGSLFSGSCPEDRVKLEMKNLEQTVGPFRFELAYYFLDQLWRLIPPEEPFSIKGGSMYKLTIRPDGTNIQTQINEKLPSCLTIRKPPIRAPPGIDQTLDIVYGEIRYKADQIQRRIKSIGCDYGFTRGAKQLRGAKRPTFTEQIENVWSMKCKATDEKTRERFGRIETNIRSAFVQAVKKKMEKSTAAMTTITLNGLLKIFKEMHDDARKGKC